MAETEFLSIIATFLRTAAELSPTPALIDIAEPVLNAELPTIVLSLDMVQRLGSGLGERSAMITDSALPWSATIDLIHPVLPEEPTFVLLSPDRRQLILPHGGLRRMDGSEGSLGSADISVTVDGTARTVVTATPGVNEVRVDPMVGLLLFGSPLPVTGKVIANYVLGQWERRVTEITGLLHVDVRAASVNAVAELSAGVVTALIQAQAGMKGLHRISVTKLSSIGLPDALRANSRCRTALFDFDYEHEVNRPDSSGGIIQRIPITSRLHITQVDTTTGEINTALVID